MKKKQLFFRFLALLLFSCIITLFLIKRIGKRTEKFEAGIYQKLSGKKPQHFQYDSLGVPVVVYNRQLGKQYNPTAIAEQAIIKSDNQDTTNIRSFFNCINWLSANYTVLNDSSIIFLDYFNWPSYNMTSPWRSAMNQGRAMQAFIKAFEKTGDTLYMNLAKKSMNSLYTEVNNGGVTYKDSVGWWYEEYADDNVPQSRVLNGMIVVLEGLSDYYEMTQDPGALLLFNEGVRSVKNTLHLYDDNGHSNYDILGKTANSWYHKFHIELLEFLYSETNDPIIKEYGQKWLQYKESSYLSSLVEKPTRIGVFTVFSLFVGVLMIVFIFSYFVWFRKKQS